MLNWRERSLRWRTNASRLQNGRAPLLTGATIGDAARLHSQRMASQRQLEHGDLGWTTGRARWAQNIGVGANVAEVHRAFMDSPEHRANVLGPYSIAGYGVAVDSRGAVWVTVNFSS